MPFTPLALRPIGPGVGLAEADGHAAGGGQHDFVAGLVTTTSTSSSPSRSLMAMMPPFSGRL